MSEKFKRYRRALPGCPGCGVCWDCSLDYPDDCEFSVVIYDEEEEKEVDKIWDDYLNRLEESE